MENIRVEGIEETERVLNEMIKEFPKQTVAAGLRSAAKPFVNRTKEAGPEPEFSKLAGVKVYTKGKEPLMAAGQFGGRNKRVLKNSVNYTVRYSIFGGKKRIRRTLISYMSMYYISYWLNHGTLSNRNPAYGFKNARKPVSAGWRGGIKSTERVDKAWETTKAQVISLIPVEMRKAGDRFVKRMQAKGLIK